MKVILTKNVAKLGKKLDVVEVSDGYASNYLFPQGLAERATDSRIAQLDAQREAVRASEDAKHAMLAEKLEALQEEGITITAKADTAGHLYKKIHEADVHAVLTETDDIALSKEAVLLEAVIAQTGDYTARIEEGDVRTSIPVHVVAE
jgi:large subunit ribosomal protein L9